MTIKALIFDWAGTTVDYGSRAPIVAFQQAFANVGVEISEAEIRQDMGLDKYTHIHKIINLPLVQNNWQARFQVLPSHDDCERIYQDFKTILLASLTDFATLKPGMPAVIDYLDQHQIAYGTTTGYDAEMLAIVAPIAAKQGYRPSVNITSAQTNGIGRPAPAMLELACDQLAVTDPATVLKIGDSINDILEGQNANVRTVGIVDGSNLMGSSQAEFEALTFAEQTARRAKVTADYQAAGADYILQSMVDLPSLLTTINQPVIDTH
ncbi:phosphonoacetaldehyde hydrolase [Lactobacillus sp. CBA3606]|uniref:phosphonoacetaldehyde hydrolase n=1 Tax=Lactobacillus sp. CBA3606 TaxID=2099789 RepID=UPI000CFCA9DC|nr:phosphonoacetaldehyde hydrolase [Lactobacillus sp. CBA3606]AVK64488.1 phosphonoacetaldehyde hydrolase [Lactobacillus sp. CBA3606]